MKGMKSYISVYSSLYTCGFFATEKRKHQSLRLFHWKHCLQSVTN